MAFKIFISYGHDKYSVVPKRIESSLKNQGHEVFIDLSLPDTRLFDSELEKKIKWCDIVIFFMTRHSVRETSVCRDELAYARNFEKRVIPIMLEMCQVPLLVSRLQWINCNCYTPNNDSTDVTILPDQYNDFVEYLSDAINNPSSYENEGSILSQLNPENLDIEIAKNSALCKERPALTNRIHNWVVGGGEPDSSKSPFLWIRGNLGSGKSCFVSWLAIHKQNVAGLHLCRAQMPKTCSIKSIVSTLAFSLAIRSNDFQDFLRRSFDFSLLESLSCSELFKILFVDGTKAINDISTDTIFVIDGIDELSKNAQEGLAEALIANRDYLPVWMRLILTSRDNRQLRGQLSFIPETISLEEMALYQDTMRAFLKECFHDNREIETVINNSAGNFIYVKCLIEEYARSGRIECYPTTMAAIYHHSFTRIFPEDSYDEIEPLLQIMVVARRPLTLMEYAYLLDRSQREIIKLLDKLGSFVVNHNGSYSLYHKSLLDWLIDENVNAEYYIARRDANKYVASIIEKQYYVIFDSADSEFEYIKRHCFYHLIKSRNVKLIGLLIKRDEKYLEDSFIDTVTDLAIAGNIEDIQWIYGAFSPLPEANIAVRRMTKRLVEFGFYNTVSAFLARNKYLEIWVGPYAELIDKRMKGRTKEVIEDCHKELWNSCPDHIRADICFYEGEGHREQGNITKAKECYAEAVELTKINHTTNSSYFLSLANMADVEYVNGNIPQALQLISEIEHNPEILDIESARYIINRLKGHIYQATLEIDKSREYYSRSLECAYRLKKRYSIIESLNSLAEVLPPKDSLSALSQSLEMCGGDEDENYTIETGKAYYVRAKTRNILGQYEDALKDAQKSKNILNDKYVPGMLYAYYEEGIALFHLGKTADALPVLQNCCLGYREENIYPNRRLAALKYLLKARLIEKDFSDLQDRLADIPHLEFYPRLSQSVNEIDKLELSFELLKILISGSNGFSIGYHNENYIIPFKGNKYVLRLPVDDFEVVDVRLYNENKMLDYANEHLPFLLAPRYIYSGEYGSTSFSIHSFVNGTAMSQMESEIAPIRDSMVGYLAESMAKMHIESRKHPLPQCKEYSDVKSFYDFDYTFIKNLVEKWFSKLKEMFLDFGFPDNISDLLTFKQDMLEEREFVLCHCDIHRGNLMYEEKEDGFLLHFIDWELVQYADPVYDVAIHFHKIHYTKEQEDLFLSIYCDKLGYDVYSVSEQIQIYQQLEEVKSSTIDAIRYASAIQDVTPEKRSSNNDKYAYKLKSLALRFPSIIKRTNCTAGEIDTVFLKYNDATKKAVSQSLNRSSATNVTNNALQ